MKIEFEVSEREGRWLRDLTDVYDLGCPLGLSSAEEAALFDKIRDALTRVGFETRTVSYKVQ